jgi:hypothetical protein
LHLSPHLVFTGTPTSLETGRKRKGISPRVIVMTYTALAWTGSGVGKGGFDQDSIENFLQGNNVQYVILDEVHTVAELMAYGFVAPFAEFGVPFAYSDREQRVHDLLDVYKMQLRA